MGATWSTVKKLHMPHIFQLKFYILIQKQCVSLSKYRIRHLEGTLLILSNLPHTLYSLSWGPFVLTQRVVLE